LLGLAALVPALALRLWASGYLRKGEVLATSGPYSLCRNPLYVGSLLMVVGFAWAAQSGLLLLASIGLFLLIYLPTIAREERELRAKFGADYADYAAAVPRLVPLGRRVRAEQPWSWSRCLRHREPGTTALALLAYSLLALKLWL
jgi:protein-S-isoprenylcysteine O-methyltransferase Ste14